MMNEYDVNILIPPAKDESDEVTISGARENVKEAINALNRRVDEIEAENEDKVSFVVNRTFPILNIPFINLLVHLSLFVPRVWQAFVKNKDRDYNFRSNENDPALPKSKTNFIKRSFRYSGAKR